MRYGYARVSTTDQKLDIQLDLLKKAGCRKIFTEKQSGATGERREFKKLLKLVKAGDEIIVTRLDRAMRNMRELLNVLDDLHKRGVGFLSLKEEWANLSSPSSKLLLHILSAVGEFERDLIRSRIHEGREKALAAGVKFGRRSKLTDTQRMKMQELLGDGKTQVEIAALMGVNQSTISYQMAKLGA